jgi:hypothetical protein
LFERYPDRFLLRSDTWVPERWSSYGEIMAGYRGWLGGQTDCPWQCEGAVCGAIDVGQSQRVTEKWHD